MFQAIQQARTYNNEALFDAASIMLGLANISEWISLIRYLGYSSKYYVCVLISDWGNMYAKILWACSNL